MNPRRRHRRLLVLTALYALLLIASHIVQRLPRLEHQHQHPLSNTVEIDMVTREGPDPSDRLHLGITDHNPDPQTGAPIILLHGSPGSARDFMFPSDDEGGRSLFDLLAADQRRIIAVDLPGFGRSDPWIPDYSFEAAAYAIIELLDALAIERAHLVCWSASGGVGLHAADIAPDRIASLTMLASIGSQETEGSGSYWFEQSKYAISLPFVVALPEVIPHFGTLGSTSFRHTFIRSFLDSDQRPLEDIMARLQTPTLILHGRHDPLVPDWAAEHHHAIMPSSRLVMLDASHFLPVLQPGQTADCIIEHADRHDTPGVPPLTHYEDLAPEPPAKGPAKWLDRLGEILRWTNWWLICPLLALFAWRRHEAATTLAALFVAAGNLDFGVAFLGLASAAFLPPRTRTQQARFWRTATQFIIWTLCALSISSFFAILFHQPAEAWKGWAVLPLFIALVAFLRLARHVWTWTGRRRIAAAVTRAINHEWWPTWVYYSAIAPTILVAACRARHPLAFTAANPGIENGGGFVGESKSGIIANLQAAGPSILHALLLEPVEDRAQRARHAIETMPQLGGYPIVLKPDRGQRGVGVHLLQSHDQLARACNSIPGPAMLQRAHMGPHECSVFWIRKPASLDPRPINQRDGFIYSITRKDFQHIVGDGKRSIRTLIWSSPRFRCQADMLLARFADRLDEIPAQGHHIAVSFAGNHAQGTRFRDGEDLITPELEAAINTVARSFTDNAYDYGRFDLRYETEDDLRAGIGFAIIEANGVTSESTNMYDPDRSFLWARRTMAEHWKHLYRIGRERMDLGQKPITIRRFAFLCWQSLRGKA